MRELLRSFILRCEAEGKPSAATLALYAGDLGDAIGEFERQGVRDAGELKPRHVQQYMSRLRQEGRSPSTLARRLVSLRAWCRFLREAGRLPSDPCAGIESPIPERKPPQGMAPDDVDRLLEAPDVTTPAGLRDRAMLELLYAAGLRVSELLALDVGSVRTELGFLHCLGPGGQERMAPFGAPAARWLDRYRLEARPLLLRAAGGDAAVGPDVSALFLNAGGTRLSRQGFWKIVKKHAASAAIASDITPHALRHAFACHLLDNGADIRAVQEMLGHKAASSTLAYRSQSRVKVKEAYDRAHPRARSGPEQNKRG